MLAILACNTPSSHQYSSRPPKLSTLIRTIYRWSLVMVAHKARIGIAGQSCLRHNKNGSAINNWGLQKFPTFIVTWSTQQRPGNRNILRDFEFSCKKLNQQRPIAMMQGEGTLNGVPIGWCQKELWSVGMMNSGLSIVFFSSCLCWVLASLMNLKRYFVVELVGASIFWTFVG